MTKRNDWQKNGFKGKVKSYYSDGKPMFIFNERGYITEDYKYYPNNSYRIISIKYDDNDNEIERVFHRFRNGEKKLLSVERNEFDTNGRLTVRSEYDNHAGLNFKFVDKSTYQYNEKGDLTERITLCYHDDVFVKKKIAKNTYKYNANGNKIESHSCDENGELTYRCMCQYDENGFKLKESRFWYKAKKVTSEYISICDNSGNTLEECISSYTSDGKLDYKTICRYDKQGYLLEEVHYSNDKFVYSANGKTTYKYDEKGNITECSKYNSNNILERITTYEYDFNGNPIEVKKYIDGELYEISTYRYDKYCNIAEICTEENRNEDTFKHLGLTLINNLGKRNFTCKYEYDEKANWIKKTEFENGVLKDVKERFFEYFG